MSDLIAIPYDDVQTAEQVRSRLLGEARLREALEGTTAKA